MKTGKYIQELLKLVEDEKSLAERCVKVGIIPDTTVLRQIVERLEDLPIIDDGVAERGWMYFVLCSDGWYPATGGNQNNDWLNYRIDYTDGAAESGSCRPYRWAHCTADNKPNYHWHEEIIQGVEV